ncbi:MAG TPA: hypothetical protein DC049_19130 [Spirochaetia bacterium]|nr:hypothetical protein [Spirochaetia bacterium]
MSANSLLELFSSYPYKSLQQKIQKIDQKTIINYYLEKFEKAEFSCIHKENGRPAGCISSVRFSFLSDFFKKNIYTIADFIARESSGNIYQSLIRELLEKNHKMDFAICKVPLDDYSAVNALVNAGFYYICSEAHLTCNLENTTIPQAEDFSGVSGCSEEDLPQVLEIASRSHENIRYYYDNYFDNSRVDQLYRRILQDEFKSSNAEIFVYREDKTVAGFISIIYNRRLSELMGRGYASLDFIGVDTSRQHSGIGLILNNYALSRLRSRNISIISVKTMASNYPALRLLAKTGFFPTSQNIVLHYRSKTAI